MSLKHIIVAATIAAAAAMSQPAAAYDVTTTGHTRASPQLAVDIMRTISRYSRATGGCSFIFSTHMEVLPDGYAPMRTGMRVIERGGHHEEWSLNACAARQRFLIGMWPSPRGGSDFVVTPLTGRMSLTSGVVRLVPRASGR